MRHPLLPAAALVLGLSISPVHAQSTSAADRFWPQWRGPLGSGVAPHARPPLEWSETQNVRWKVAIPGRGSSTPIVWGDTVIVTTAVPSDKPLTPRTAAAAPGADLRRNPDVSAANQTQAFVVMAIGRGDGKLRWQKTVREEFPHEGSHKDGTFASPSAVTDGERLYASFGSRGLYCLDLKGKLLWEKDLGLMTTKMSFGEGASPALHGDHLVVNWDHEGESFVAAFEKKTGKELWRTPRDEKTTWATPLVVAHGDTTQVVTSATSRIRSYDLKSGRLLWEGPGLTQNTIPSPVFGDGLLYLTSGFRGNALFAVKLAAAKGDITGTAAIVWSYDKDTPYVPSPLLYQGGLYFLKSNSAILTRLDAATGEKHFSERLERLSNVYASPVAADGRVYVVSREGVTAVLQAGRELKVLAVNTLEDGFDASPALVEGDLYLRGKEVSVPDQRDAQGRGRALSGPAAITSPAARSADRHVAADQLAVSLVEAEEVQAVRAGSGETKHARMALDLARRGLEAGQLQAEADLGSHLERRSAVDQHPGRAQVDDLAAGVGGLRLRHERERDGHARLLARRHGQQRLDPPVPFGARRQPEHRVRAGVEQAQLLEELLATREHDDRALARLVLGAQVAQQELGRGQLAVDQDQVGAEGDGGADGLRGVGHALPLELLAPERTLGDLQHGRLGGAGEHLRHPYDCTRCRLLLSPGAAAK